jgi:hypothetical protein
MKKSIRGISFWLAIFSLAVFLFSQQTVEREYVQVLNIEMLVRVMKDGRPLAGLKKGDFTLLENGRKQDINGFVEVHRSIAPAEAKEKPPAGEKQRPGRLFLLFFWINESAVKVDEALDYFFKDIYRQGDRVILADQRQLLEINSGTEKQAKVKDFKAGLLSFCREQAGLKDGIKLNLESILEEFGFCMEVGTQPLICKNKLKVRYAQLLKEYRMEKQAPNSSRLEAMSQSLEVIDADKWALVFFQHDFLPLFDIEQLKLEGGRFHLDKEMIDEIERMNRDLFFPMEALRLADSLRTRFIQANAQFYLMLLDSRLAPISMDAASQYTVVNPFPVFSSWEDAFRQITAATGGEIMDGNRMKEALAEVANREDVYYVLTYAPDQGKRRERRVDLSVKRDGVKVIHGRRVEMESLPQVKLATIEPIPGKVMLGLEDLYMIGQGEQRSGLVRVTLSAASEGEKPQILVQDMEVATTGSVEIPIKDLEPGRYRLAVRGVDRLTGLEARDESVLDILGGEMPVETMALLKLAADYSERLRHAAFRFICQETVSEDVLVRDTVDRSSYKRLRTSWLYDYQVVVRHGRVSESRVLLRKNKKKARVENASLETRFRSLYSVFLPATLFAADKQSAFFYRLEKHEKMYGRQVARLAMAPRPGFEDHGAGTAWVDEKTGAVLKIELSQRAIKGIEAVEKKAQKSGARLLVSDVHDYGVERDGIWLPSSTTISEYYVISVVPVKENRSYIDWNGLTVTSDPAKYVSTGANRQIELSRTWVEYSDFKFFVVDVQTKEEQ